MTKFKSMYLNPLKNALWATVLFILPLHSPAQGLSHDWTATFNGIFTPSAGGFGISSPRMANHVCTDAQNNVLVTGCFSEGTTDFDPGAATYPLTPVGQEDGDLYIAKLSSTGNLRWVKHLGTPNQLVQGMSITSDASSNVFVCGVFFGTVDFNPGAPVLTFTHTQGNGFVMKLDSTGNFLWAKQMGGACTSLSADPSGNIHVVGEFYGTKDFDPGPAVNNLTCSDTYMLATDGFICKLNASGQFISVGAFKGINSQTPWCITHDAAGNIYIAGNFKSAIKCSPYSGEDWLYQDCNENTLFVIKLNASGQLMWAKKQEQFLAVASPGKLIALDAAGNIYVAGKEVKSYSPSGQLRFSLPVQTVAVTCSASGQLFITGKFSGIRDFNFSNAAADTANMNAANGAVFIGRYNSQGDFIHAVQYGKPDLASWPEDQQKIEVMDIHADPLGNLFSAGYYTGNPDADPGNNDYLLSTPGAPTIENTQIYIQKLNIQ